MIPPLLIVIHNICVDNINVFYIVIQSQTVMYGQFQLFFTFIIVTILPRFLID